MTDFLLKNIVSAENLVNFTATDTAIVKSGIVMSGTDSGTGDVHNITIVAPNDASFTSSYTLTMPVNDGNAGQVLTTDGSGVLSWSADATGLFSEDSNGGGITDHNIYGGTGAGTNLASGAVENFLAGVNAGNALTTGDSNIVIGNTALLLGTDAIQNVAIGVGALSSATSINGANTNSRNIAIGHDSLLNVDGSAFSEGGYNVAIGDSTGATATTANSCILIGASANVSGATVGNEIVIGYGATGKGANTALIGNDDTTDVYIGSASAGTSPPNLVLTGDDGGTDYTIKIRAPSNGSFTANSELILPADVPSAGEYLKVTSVGSGIATLEWGTAGGAFTESGTNSIYSAGSGDGGVGNYNFSAIDGALNNASLSGADNIGIGRDAGSGITTGNNNVCIGYNTGQSIAGGSSNTCIGYGASARTNSSYQTAVGYNVIAAGLTTCAFGYNIGTINDSGGANVWIGNSVANSSTTTGNWNIGIGASKLGSVAGSLTSGTSNIFIGTAAGKTTTTGSNNIFIGEDIFGVITADEQIAIGHTITCTAAGQVCIGVNPDAANANGLFLRHRAIVGGTNTARWVAVGSSNELVEDTSSQRFKEDIKDYEPVDNFDLLRPTTYRAKDGYGAVSINDPIRYVGMIAEEVNEIYPEFVVYEQDGVTPRSLQYDKFVALLIHELQKERQQRKAFEEQVRAILGI